MHVNAPTDRRRPGPSGSRCRSAARGTTLLLLVSIVIAGSPLVAERAAAQTAAPEQTQQRPTRQWTEAAARAIKTAFEEEHEKTGERWVAPRPRRTIAGTTDEHADSGRLGSIRVPVRVALLDLPPPAAA